ncbi:MAG: signal recognition particle receptor subunit alpha, partial [Nannocystaceae bacterium]
MQLELIVILVALAGVLVGAGVIYFVVRSRRALPGEEARPAIEPAAEPEAAPAVEPAQPRRVEPRPESAVPLPVDKPREAAIAAHAAVEAREQRERLREGLARTRGGFVARLSRLFRGKPKVSDALKDEIEEVLFTADIGSSTAEKLLARVTESLDRSEVADIDAVWQVIHDAVLEILAIDAPPLTFDAPPSPYVLLMIGVNGVGKTTTLGKLAAQHQAAGRTVLLVAGDTFRAAAGEQLEVWARRVGCGFFPGKEGADPSSVIFDGILHGRAEGYDVVLCDTAGRLHTKKTLMDELQKIR